MIEPWNPAVLFKIRDIHKSWRVYVYTLLPWSFFIFGMIFSVAFFRSCYASEHLLSKIIKRPFGFVMYWIFVFCLLMYKNLWYPIPNGLLDWFILLVGSLIPIFIHAILKNSFNEKARKYQLVMSTLHFIYFVSVVGLFTYLGITYNLWPGFYILGLLIGLNIVTFLLVYIFVYFLSLQTYSERLWLYSFLSMYLFVLLTPWYGFL